MAYDRLPFDLESEIGNIVSTDEIYPGVYFIGAQDEGSILLKEYYAVLETAGIFSKVQAYGREYKGLRLYSIDVPNSGWRIVEYETSKLLQKAGLPLRSEETLHSIAVFAAEEHPEYFGASPAPLYTPWGYTLRYRTFENGVYWIDTDQCEEVLAVCYPVWDGELSEAAQQIGEQTTFDKQNGIHSTLGYLFFSQETAAAAIYELMETRPQWNGSLIDKAALMNAIWKQLPNYALLSNWWEQESTQTVQHLLKKLYGVEADLPPDPNHLIMIYPDSGVNYLLL